MTQLVKEKTKPDKFVSETQKSQQKQNQPIGAKWASASERQGNHAQPSESDVTKANKQPLKQKAAIIQTSQLSESNSDAKGSEQMSEERMRRADQPPIKTPVCYTLN